MMAYHRNGARKMRDDWNTHYVPETTWEYLRQIAVVDLTDDERIVSERMGVHNND